MEPTESFESFDRNIVFNWCKTKIQQRSSSDCLYLILLDSRPRWCSRRQWWRGSSATWSGGGWRRTPWESSHRSSQSGGRCKSRRSSCRTPPRSPTTEDEVFVWSVCNSTQMTTMRSQRTMTELVRPRSQRTRPSVRLILPSCTNSEVCPVCVVLLYLQCQPLGEGGSEAEEVDGEAEDSAVVEVAGGPRPAHVLRPVEAPHHDHDHTAAGG